ncbi:MAG: nucleotide exchange factor GrpE, partial [Tissierellales bacterium]|nr:nucleotide exchange factor GrpE [Tissierellales bacterium]
MAKKKNKKEEIKKQEQEVKDDDKTGEETIDIENQEDSPEKEKSQVEDETKIEQESESELKDKQLEEINNKLLRLQADFLNYKTRTEKEKFKYYNDAIEDLVCEMLPILDNFERALENLESDENLSQGVEMILNQFINLLKKYGVEEIDALGKKFDPKLHHGVSTEDTDEEEDIVVEV